MYRRVRLLISLSVAAAALLGGVAAPAGAVPVVFGSQLQLEPNMPFGCEARPYPTAVTGVAQLIPTGQATCMWWQSGVSQASTYVPRGQGVVVGARVRSGSNPAPLRISVISSGAGGFCCTQQHRSEVFQPAPNAVTTVPLFLPAGSGIDPTRQGGQYNDIVVVTGAGPGSLPVHDTGRHGTFDLSAPWAAFLHPELTNNNSNLDVGTMDGFEVLLQVLWCGAPGTGSTATGARASADPDELKGFRAQGTSCPAPVGVSRANAPLSSGRARVRLRCSLGPCSGSVLLRRRGSRVQLGRRTAFTAPGNVEFAVPVPLTANGRAALRSRSRVAADAVVTLSGVAEPLKLAVSIKR